jgi:hypothetical protein
MQLHASAYPASRSLPFPTAASSMSSYDKFKTPSSSASGEDLYKRTLARLERIQAHLSTAPRGARMKDKVCIVTGVGSLKGIGCVLVTRVGVRANLRRPRQARDRGPLRARGRAPCVLPGL